MTQFGESRSKI